jgi:hypothetical protein
MLMRDEPVIGQNCVRSRGFCFFCPQKKKESKCSLIVVYWVELSQIMMIRFEYYGVSPATLDLSFVYGRSAEPGRIAAYHGSCTFAGSTPEGIPLGKVPKGFGCEQSTCMTGDFFGVALACADSKCSKSVISPPLRSR